MILAAGRSERFGGLKQLAPVRPSGEAIMDLTAADALASGYTGVILVVREEIIDQTATHVRHFWPSEMPVEIVCQDQRRGTAAAVAVVRPFVDGPFVVANADDLYDGTALRRLREHIVVSFVETVGEGASMPSKALHALVTYRLSQTILGDRPVNRGICEIGADRQLLRIAEHRVTPRSDGGYDGTPIVLSTDAAARGDGIQRLHGGEPVSMNLWGFHPSILDVIDAELEQFDPATASRPELLLPDVAGALLADGTARLATVESDARCIGITYPEDLCVVRDELARQQLESWRSEQSMAG